MATKILGLLMLVLVLGCTMADVYPGPIAFYDICVMIANDVSTNNVRFRYLQSSNQQYCQPNQLVVDNTLPTTREQLCQVLVSRHNTENAPFLGITTVGMDTACEQALQNPAPYSSTDWDAWAGRHCGTWYNVVGTSCLNGCSDRAIWHNPEPNGVFYHQDAEFYARDCDPGHNCHDGWNESGGTESLVWGWDHKEDSRNHCGYQGCHVGYTFNFDGAKCIIWITGEEAFLECIKNGKRTAAGFWGYGHFDVLPENTLCQGGAAGQPLRRRPGPVGPVGPPGIPGTDKISPLFAEE